MGAQNTHNETSRTCYMLPKSYVYHYDSDCGYLSQSSATLRTVEEERLADHMNPCTSCVQ